MVCGVGGKEGKGKGKEGIQKRREERPMISKPKKRVVKV
jgi:hypothetical protein